MAIRSQHGDGDIGRILAGLDLHGALRMLLLALALGLLISSPQWMRTLSYYPKSIRAGKSFSDKTTIGKVNCKALFKGLLQPWRRELVDGVFYPEVCAYIGVIGLVVALFTSSWHQWSALILFIILARGGWLFRMMNPLMLRIPARWMYFVGVTLAFMAVDGLYHSYITRIPLIILILLQSFDLLILNSGLWPMRPFVQRPERPSKAFENVIGWSPCRERGLPFPCTTGQIHHIKTLGYNGGSQLKAMARLRGDKNPNGSGDHRGLNMTEEDLEWWSGAKTWADLEAKYGG